VNVYKQVLDPFHGSLALTAIFAALPLLTLFVLLGVVRLAAWKASVAALLVALVVAVAVYPMPLGQALLSGTEGAAFGFFPIMWIVINAIWIYNLTVQTGHFDVLRRSFSSVSPDPRIQAIIIAFCFGSLLEALAGFGAPVAICAVMLVALGMSPILAASLALIADTAPVAFGAIAVPITTLGTVTNLPVDQLGAMVGRQTPLLALFVPFVLVGVVGGTRGIRQVWPAALTAGVVFGVAQFASSNYISIPLTDIIASLASAGAVVLLLRVWHPSEVMAPMDHAGGEPSVAGPAMGSGLGQGPDDDGRRGASAPARAGTATSTVGDRMERVDDGHVHDPRGEVVKAYAPYGIIIAIFGITQIPALKSALDATAYKFAWPGLHLLNPKGKPQASVLFNFNWLSAAGTVLLVAGILTAIVLRVGPGRALRTYWETLVELKFAILTVMVVLALAYVMNASGQTSTLGKWMAGAGGLFALLSPILGWLGVAVTGSDTSANSLFGALQVAAAKGAGLNPVLMAAGNSSGGVIGKMISPQNLAIGASAVGLAGKEGDLFRKVLPWTLVFLVGACVLVYLQSTPALSWMVVH
jgi:lactate permease